MGRLDGKCAVVTGAGRGIGRGHCLRLAEYGAAVIVNDVGPKLEPVGLMKKPYAYYDGVKPPAKH